MPQRLSFKLTSGHNQLYYKKNVMMRLGFCLIPLLLAACGAERETATRLVPDTLTGQPLCVSNACGQVIDIATIPDAENTLTTPDGRVFVSGGTGVFEVKRSSNSYTVVPINEVACNFTGLAQRGEVLYANCFDGQLYAARLTAAPKLQAIHDYGLAAPNGLATGPDGALYLTNGPLATSALPDAKVVRVQFDASDAFKVTKQEDWLASGLTAPNGIAIRGREIYVTDSSLLPPALGRIERILIDADGMPGERTQIATLPSIPDDLSVVDEGLLVTQFVQGNVLLIGFDGSTVQQTDPLGLAFPSSVRLTSGPLFAPGDVLITQKGILGDTSSPYGNRLSILRPNAR